MYVLLLLTQTYMPALGVRQFHAIHFIPFALKNAQTKIKKEGGWGRRRVRLTISTEGRVGVVAAEARLPCGQHSAQCAVSVACSVRSV